MSISSISVKKQRGKTPTYRTCIDKIGTIYQIMEYDAGPKAEKSPLFTESGN